MTPLLHICPEEDWQEAQTQGEYRAASLATEGFIHFSTPEQVIGTADLLFRRRQGLALLVIAPEELTAEVRYEDPGCGLLFPHLYGPLPLAAVIAVVPFPPNADGSFSLPAALSRLLFPDDQGIGS